MLGTPASIAFRRGRLRGPALWALRWAAFWAGIVGLALYMGLQAETSPKTLLAPAGLAVATLLTRRYPVIVVGAVIFVAGAAGSLVAFFGLPTGSMVELGLAAVILAVATGLLFGNREHTTLRTWAGGLALAVLALGSLGWVVVDEVSYVATVGWRTQWLFALFAIAIAFAPWARERDKRLMWMIVGVGGVLAAYAIFRWIVGPDPREIVQAVDVAGRYIGVEGKIRLFGAAGDGHAFAESMVPLVPFALALTLGLRGRTRVLTFAVGAMCFAAVIGSDVRSALAATVAAMLTVLTVTLMARGLGPGRIGAVAVSLLLALIAVAGLAASQTAQESGTFQRFGAILDPGSDEAFQERQYRWGLAFDGISEDPGGHGLGMAGGITQFTLRFSTVGNYGVDNSYLKIAYEQGVIVALLFILALLAIAVRLVVHAMSETDRTAAALTVGGLGALVSFGILLNFETVYIESASALVSWLIIGLGMRQVTLRHSRRAAETSE